jgi:hypothetical protein
VYDFASVLASATESVQVRESVQVPTIAAARRDWLAEAATAVVLLVGIGLRVWRPDLAQTNFDESNVGSLVAAWKYQGWFPLAGTVSSYGFRAGEGWPWFAALGLRFTDDPYALIATGVLAGVAGLLACWWVARRWLGVWGGVTAALVHGTMFWCVLLERGAWQPVYLQAPMALCLDALLRLGVQKRPWALAVACGWLGLLVSIHYTAVAFVLVVPLAIFYARHVLRVRHLLGAVIVGALPLLPFLVFEVNPEVRFREIVGLLSLSRGTSSLDLDTITSTIQISTTYGAAGLGGEAATWIVQELGRWTSLSALGPVLAAAGLVVGIVVWPRGAMGWLIAAWTLAPIAAYLHHSAPVIFHYMFIEFPGLAMCVAILGAWAAKSSSLVWRLAIGGAIVASATASALSMLVLLHALDQFDLSGGYGVPVGSTRLAGAAARDALRGGGMVLIGDDPHAGEVLRFGVGYRIPSRSFEDCRDVPYAPDAVYLLASEQTPGARVLDSAGAPLLARIPRPGGDAYRVYGPPARPEALQPQSDPDNAICQDRAVWDSSG